MSRFDHFFAKLSAAGFAFIVAAAVPAPVMAQDNEEVDQGGRRIVGGEPADIKDHPWQVAIDIKGGLCGGSIIGDKWVLTAAHCFKLATQPADVKVKMGVTNIVDSGTWVEVERIVRHEGYVPATHENDLTLLKLTSRTGGSIISLAKPGSAPSVGQSLEVTGWGHTAEKGQRSPILMKAAVPVIDNAVCNEPQSYNGLVKEHLMCAGHKDGGIDSCQGDSGGPLVLRSWTGSTLVGVVSWGVGCARKLKYGVYTRVADYRDWVGGAIASGGN